MSLTNIFLYVKMTAEKQLCLLIRERRLPLSNLLALGEYCSIFCASLHQQRYFVLSPAFARSKYSLLAQIS
jgi:hypothetical protein